MRHQPQNAYYAQDFPQYAAESQHHTAEINVLILYVHDAGAHFAFQQSLPHPCDKQRYRQLKHAANHVGLSAYKIHFPHRNRARTI